MFLTIFITVISGVLVYVLSQFIDKYYLSPLWNYFGTINMIDYQLKFYSRDIFNSSSVGVRRKTNDEIRKLSCGLESNYKSIPKHFSQTLTLINLIPSREIISDSAKDLVLLANTAGSTVYVDKLVVVEEKLRHNLNIIKL